MDSLWDRGASGWEGDLAERGGGPLEKTGEGDHRSDASWRAEFWEYVLRVGDCMEEYTLEAIGEMGGGMGRDRAVMLVPILNMEAPDIGKGDAYKVPFDFTMVRGGTGGE